MTQLPFTWAEIIEGVTRATKAFFEEFRTAISQLEVRSVPLGAPSKAIAGDFVPDLKSQQRMFPVTLTGDLVVQTPVNMPEAPELSEIRIVLKQDATGGRKVTWPGVTEWRGGAAPPIKTAPGAITEYVLFCDDGVNWYGLGELSQAETEALIAALAPVGLSEAAVLTLIAARALITSEHPTAATNAVANGAVLIGSVTAGQAEWVDLTSYILLRANKRTAPRTTVAASVTPAELGRYYSVTKKGITISLPTLAELSLSNATEGETIVVENASEGAIKVKGLFAGVEAIKEVFPGEIVTYWAAQNLTEWFSLNHKRVAGDGIVPLLDTTSLATTAAITAAYEKLFTPNKPPRAGNEVHDNVNHWRYVYNGVKWEKSSVYTVI